MEGEDGFVLVDAAEARLDVVGELAILCEAAADRAAATTLIVCVLRAASAMF